jgi:PAS domain S-box-containing protein
MSDVRILYIEDEAQQRASFQSEAAERGIHLVAASSGGEGLRLFDPAKVDLVLCDLNMPGLGGLEVMEKIKQTAPDLPFILMTAHGTVPEAVGAIKQGADDFILKPMDFDLLEKTIYKAIESRDIQKQLANSQASLQFLTENIPDIIYAFDPQGNFISVSASAEAILGYKPDEAVGMNVLEIIHEDDRARIIQAFEEIAKGEAEVVKTVEFRMMTKTGETRHFEVNRKAVFENGKYVRNEGIARDITERKKLQDELQKHTDHLEDLVKERTERLERAYAQLLALNEASNQFNRINDEVKLFEVIPELLTDSLGFDRAFVVLKKGKQFDLRSYKLEKDSPAKTKKIIDALVSGRFEMPKPVAESFKKGNTIFVEDLTDESKWPKELHQLTGAKSLIVSPLKIKEKPIGMLIGSLAYQDRTMSEQEVARFEMFANMVGLALDKIRSYQTLENRVEERTSSLLEANQELTRSKAQFEAILEAAPNVLIMADTEDNVIAINRVAETVFDIKISDVIYKSVGHLLDLIKDRFEDAELLSKRFYNTRMEDHARGGMDFSQQGVRQISPQQRLLVPMFSPLEGKEGEYLGRFWTFADLTEFEKATELLHKVVEASPIPFIVSRVKDGKIIFVNEPLADLVGYKPKDLIGKLTPDFYYDPDDRKVVVSRLQKDGFLKDFEVRIKRYDGEPIWMMFNIIITEIAGEKVIMGGLYDIDERKRAEEALRESEERFRQLTENINEVFWMVDPVTQQMLYISPKFKDIVGIDAEKVTDSPELVLEIVHPEDRERVREAMSKQITGEYDEEYRIVRPDGSLRWIREKAFPINDEEGNLHRICGVSEDFTQRKEAEEALLMERNFISAVLDTAGALVVVLDQHGQIVRFNKACERISGYTFAEVEGRVFWEFLLLPEEMDLVKERWEHLLTGQLPNSGENFWVTKSGEKRLITWSNTSLMHDCCNVDFVVAIGIDITETREAEENLKLYKKIFMTTNDAIAIIDKEGKVFARNPAHVKYTGYSDEEVIGKSITSITSEEVTQKIGESMMKYGHFRGEIDFHSKDGIDYQVDMSIFPIESEAGEPDYYVGMGRDITERKKAQEALATRLRYEEGLANCSQAMLEEDTIAEEIQESLDHLLAAADVGRVYFYENPAHRESNRRSTILCFRTCLTGRASNTGPRS